MLSRFVLIAAQEVNVNFKIFKQIVCDMDRNFDFSMSDKDDNAKWLVFICWTYKVSLDKLWED